MSTRHERKQEISVGEFMNNNGSPDAVSRNTRFRREPGNYDVVAVFGLHNWELVSRIGGLKTIASDGVRPNDRCTMHVPFLARLLNCG